MYLYFVVGTLIAVEIRIIRTILDWDKEPIRCPELAGSFFQSAPRSYNLLASSVKGTPFFFCTANVAHASLANRMGVRTVRGVLNFDSIRGMS